MVVVSKPGVAVHQPNLAFDAFLAGDCLASLTLAEITLGAAYLWLEAECATVEPEMNLPGVGDRDSYSGFLSRMPGFRRTARLPLSRWNAPPVGRLSPVH